MVQGVGIDNDRSMTPTCGFLTEVTRTIKDIKSRLESVQKSEREAVEALKSWMDWYLLDDGIASEKDRIRLFEAVKLTDTFLASREKAGEKTGTGQ